MYALTLFSSTAKVFIASCIRSKLVDFHTKSTIKLWATSVGTPSLFRSSRAISSETSAREPVSQWIRKYCGLGPTVRDLDDMSGSFPILVQLSRVFQPQFISNRKPDFPTLQLRQHEPSDPLLIQTQIPPNADIRLSLRFLEAFVVVGFDFHQRSHDILILVGIFVTEQDGLRFVIYTRFLQILERGVGVLTPQIFEAVNLLERDLS